MKNATEKLGFICFLKHILENWNDFAKHFDVAES